LALYPNITGERLVVAGIAVAALAAVSLSIAILTVAPTLGALEEAGTDQAQDQGSANHEGRLTACQIFEILAHGTSVLVPQILGHLFNLPGHSFGQAGNALLILGPEVLRGAPKGFGYGAELVGKLAFALTQAGTRSITGLLERAFRLVYHLILHTPDLVPGTATALLAGDIGSGARGFGVWHRHRIAPLADHSSVLSNQPPVIGGSTSDHVTGRSPALLCDVGYGRRAEQTAA
jgi:hypothetical protein